MIAKHQKDGSILLVDGARQQTIAAGASPTVRAAAVAAFRAAGPVVAAKPAARFTGTVTLLQLKLALNNASHLVATDALVSAAATPVPIKLAYAHSQDVGIRSALSKFIMTGLKLTQVQMNALFISASSFGG